MGIRSDFSFLLHFSMKFMKANKIAPDWTPRFGGYCVWLLAVISTFTHTQTQGQLEKVWFEYESSGINWSMSGVQVWFSQHLLDLSSLECQCLNNDK